MTPQPPRTILLRANRETVILLTAALGMTFAVSIAVHRRPAPAPAAAASVPQQQEWAGQLADLSPGPAPATTGEALTSASLVVVPPPAAPAVVAGVPRPPAKARACDGAGCPAAPAKPAPQLASAVPPAKPGAVPAQRPDRDDPGFLGKLNPLPHLPDAVRHPIDTASNAVSGWIKRL